MSNKLKTNNVKFSFENLEVWQKAVDFADGVIDVVDNLNNTDRKHFRLVEQLESSATSIAMNIAEGKGRHSKREFIQFLSIARGSLYETIALLIIFFKRDWIDEEKLNETKEVGSEVGKLLSSLINSIRRSMSKEL